MPRARRRRARPRTPPRAPGSPRRRADRRRQERRHARRRQPRGERPQRAPVGADLEPEAAVHLQIDEARRHDIGLQPRRRQLAQIDAAAETDIHDPAALDHERAVHEIPVDEQASGDGCNRALSVVARGGFCHRPSAIILTEVRCAFRSRCCRPCPSSSRRRRTRPRPHHAGAAPARRAPPARISLVGAARRSRSRSRRRRWPTACRSTSSASIRRAWSPSTRWCAPAAATRSSPASRASRTSSST